MSNHSFASAISGPIATSTVGAGSPLGEMTGGGPGSHGASSTAHPVSTVGAAGAGPQSSSLAALHYESQTASSARTAVSNLWSQLKQRIPELRNVTQYYAAEMQKYGATLLTSTAVKAAGEAFQQSLQGSGLSTSAARSRASGGELSSREEESRPPTGPRGDGSASAEPAPIAVESATRIIGGLFAPEVHYQPNPLGALRIAVHSTAIETLPSGEVYLLMSIETGFAAFEVTPQGVFELVVDLNVAASLGMAGPNAPPFSASAAPQRVVGLRALTKDLLVVATTGCVATYQISAKSFSRPQDLPFTASSLALMISPTGASHAVVGCAEFAQYCVYEVTFDVTVHQKQDSAAGDAFLSASYSQLSPCSESYADEAAPGRGPLSSVGGSSPSLRMGTATPMPSAVAQGRFREVVSICADRAVCATSSRWFAYSGMCEHPQVATEFTAQRDESAVESVTRSVMTGFNALTSNLWSTPPGPQPAAVALGTVVVYDVVARSEISGFIAHQHPLQCMKFDRTGTLLATASTCGTSICVFQILPAYDFTHQGGTDDRASVPDSPSPKMGTSVTLLYRLNRGVTQCTVTDIQFGPLAAWVALCTGVGTCHVFSIPDEHRNAYGSRSRTKAAPAITAGGRARSAWSSTSVNPQVAFRPIAPTVTQGQVISVDVFLVSGSGTVTALRFSGDGAAVYWSRSIDQFSGERPATGSRPNSAGTPSPTTASEPYVQPLVPGVSMRGAAPAGDGEEEAAWRAEIELVSHPEGFGGIEFMGPITGLPIDSYGITRLNGPSASGERQAPAQAGERSDGDDWDVA